MRVYDFDNTIYDGESTLDFYLYCLRRNIGMVRLVYPVLSTLIKYKRCKISTAQLEQLCEKYMSEFLKHIEEPQKVVKEFWNENQHKIKKFYLEQQEKDDVIISASPEFLLREIAERIEIKNLLASSVDMESYRVLYLCHSKNKVNIFKTMYPDGEIDEFYTDSLNDLPMIELSRKAFIVKKNRICEYKK